MLLSALTATYSACTRCHMSSTNACSAAKSVRLAVVGDVHGQWCPDRDAAALRALDADFTLFVGDFGNERVSLVRQIAALDAPKAAILGNHDAWYTMTACKRSRSPPAAAHHSPHGSPADQQQHIQRAVSPEEPDRVQQQLDALGSCHVGYAHLQLPVKNISLVGARPFSKGGKSLRTIRDFLLRLYHIGELKESADKILDVIDTQVPADNTLILMGHNGPAGLGSERYNICGVDWVKEAGDHGDPDLEIVLQQLQQAGRHVALVVFGHMHHTLKGSGLRQMVHVDGITGTVYLNAATVPRVVKWPRKGPTDTLGATKHHFLVIDMQDGQVHTAADVWVKVTQAAASSAGTLHSGSSAAATNDDPLPLTGSDVTDVAPQRMSCGPQQPQQLVLGQREQLVPGGWLVQVVGCQEVLRTTHDSPVQKHYWDAYNAEWRTVTVQLLQQRY